MKIEDPDEECDCLESQGERKGTGHHSTSAWEEGLSVLSGLKTSREDRNKGPCVTEEWFVL